MQKPDQGFTAVLRFLMLIPALQSHAVDIIAGEREGSLLRFSRSFAGLSVFYSVLQTMQGWFCAKLGQRSHQASEAGSLQSDDHAADRLH